MIPSLLIFKSLITIAHRHLYNETLVGAFGVIIYRILRELSALGYESLQALIPQRPSLLSIRLYWPCHSFWHGD